MSVRQYEPYAAQLGYLSETIHRHLTERECGIFDRGLADYHRRRNVKAFVECLSLVLNTNQKRQLLIPIRDTYVKPSDTGRFNQLVQAHGLATSLKKKRRGEFEADKNKASSDGIHKADVKRDSSGEWGFNIRGGSDQGTGVFVSWVEPESNAHTSGLQVGDQILKANETSFENITHHDAVQLVRGCKKLRLWLLSHGRVPTTHMAHKAYRWVDPDGRQTSPPPDPFTIAEQRARGDFRLGSEADERKVTVMVDSGKELGVSIRGGSEHGLGIYISKVDEASVAESYGIKVGDQILEVNGVSFLNIVHSDAARALRAQPCMVIKVKDVGKLPHSRITTYAQTQWHNGKKKDMQSGTRGKKAFQKGAGTQVMLRKHDTGIQSRGMMNEVARSVLTSHELSTFTYYLNQYEQHGLSVDNLTTALLDLLDTAEKLQLIGEVRGIIRVSDLDRYNELTIHHEIAAKKAHKKGGVGSVGSSQTRLVSREGSGVVLLSSQPRNAHQITAEVHHEDPQALQSRLSPPAAADMSLSSTLTLEDDVDFGGRDQVPQRMSPVARKPGAGTPVFHAPPPPTSEPSTSTPGTDSQQQTVLVGGLKERRQRMRPGLSDQSTVDEEDSAWDSQFSGGPSLSTIRSPQIEAMSAVSLPEIEARIQQELEQKMKREFEEKEHRLLEEHLQKLEQEKQENEVQLRAEREALEQQLTEAEERTAREVEKRVRREAEQEMRRQIEERERAVTEKIERLAAEERERLESQQEEEVSRRRRRGEEEEEKERLKMELEERIWREAEENLRHEFEARMHKEKQKLQQSEELKTAALDKAERKLQKELERKFQQQFEEKLEAERQRLKEIEQEEQRRKEALERQKQQEDIERMEADEQAKIDLEEKIRKETEAAVRAEYEARLQFETEQRARLAEEVKAHKAAEERLEQEREELERERERERERTEREQQQRQHKQQEREKDSRQQKNREEAERRERQRQEETERKERQETERRERERRETQETERRERQEEASKGRQEAERQEAERRERQAAERKRERQGAVQRDARKKDTFERQRLVRERQQREREEEEQRRQMQQQELQQGSLAHGGGGQSEEEEEEAEKLLKIQRQLAEQQEREEEEVQHRQEEIERKEREAAMAKKQSEAEHKKELQRKREENIRRREEEQHRKEEERRLRLEGQKRQQEEEERRKRQGEVERLRNTKRKTGITQQIAVKFGDETDSAVQVRQKARDQEIVKQQLVEEERRKAEEKLQRRIEKMKTQQQRSSGSSLQYDGTTTNPPVPHPSSDEAEEVGKSFGGYTGLIGDIVTVNVSKVCKKLGIAIDGGANTKQKAVIIREISPEGCAAKTAVPELRVGQQLLQVDSTSLHGLRHKETVMTIKGAFEGPMNKTITFIVLDNKEEGDEPDGSSPEPLPEPVPEPAAQPQIHPQVQLRKKKRAPEVEERMRERGLDAFIAEASSDLPSHRQPKPPPQHNVGKSFGGFTNLRGEILTIPVTKVNKKLGMAIDGGANTKQVAITIRQITPDGSAALSGLGLKVGQQILQVNSKSLCNLSHGDAVSAIKSAFEGPINKTTITFIVLDPE